MFIFTIYFYLDDAVPGPQPLELQLHGLLLQLGPGDQADGAAAVAEGSPHPHHAGLRQRGAAVGTIFLHF